MIKNLREMAVHLGNNPTDTAARAGSALAHAAADFAEDARKTLTPIVRNAEKEVKEHPVTTATLVAAALGLIGFALSRHQTR